MPGGIHAPISQWLKWPIANYIDPPTQPKYVLIFSCVIGPISVALLFARLWVRLRIQRNAGWDDWLMLASLFPVLILTIIFPMGMRLKTMLAQILIVSSHRSIPL